MIDLIELRARIAEKSAKGIHAAPVLFDIIEELEHARGERAAVVAWLRALTVEWSPRTVAYAIERGEHRLEEER